MIPLDIDLPWPPSVNHYWRKVGNRVLISREGREYRRIVVGQLAPRRMTQQPTTKRIAMTIHAHATDLRRRDLDNITKSLFDAFQHAGVYEDDEQIDDYRVVRGEKIKGGVVRISMAECVAWPRADERPMTHAFRRQKDDYGG